MVPSLPRISPRLLVSALAVTLLGGCANLPTGPTTPVELTTATVKIVGANARLEGTSKDQHVGWWTNTNTFAEWPLKTLKPGTYKVEVLYALDPQFPGSTIAVTAAGQTLSSKKLEATKNWDDYHALTLGTIKIDKPEIDSLAVRVTNKPATYVMNLQKVILTPAN